MIGLCACFLVSTALWSEIDVTMLPLAAWMYPLSRALSGLSVVSFPSAKNSGLLKTFQEKADRKRVKRMLYAWIVVVTAGMVFMFQAAGAVVAASSWVMFFYYYKMSSKQFGGTTGDLAGYFLQMCELVMLAVIVFAGGLY